MIIEWTGPGRLVPGLGRMNTGDIRTVPAGIGRALIRQGQAVEVRRGFKKRRRPAGPGPADPKTLTKE